MLLNTPSPCPALPLLTLTLLTLTLSLPPTPANASHKGAPVFANESVNAYIPPEGDYALIGNNINTSNFSSGISSFHPSFTYTLEPHSDTDSNVTGNPQLSEIGLNFTYTTKTDTQFGSVTQGQLITTFSLKGTLTHSPKITQYPANLYYTFRAQDGSNAAITLKYKIPVDVDPSPSPPENIYTTLTTTYNFDSAPAIAFGIPPKGGIGPFRYNLATPTPTTAHLKAFGLTFQADTLNPGTQIKLQGKIAYYDPNDDTAAPPSYKIPIKYNATDQSTTYAADLRTTIHTAYIHVCPSGTTQSTTVQCDHLVYTPVDFNPAVLSELVYQVNQEMAYTLPSATGGTHPKDQPTNPSPTYEYDIYATGSGKTYITGVPPGLAFSEGNNPSILNGTPTEAGTDNFTYRVTSGTAYLNQKDVPFTLTIVDAPSNVEGEIESSAVSDNSAAKANGRTEGIVTGLNAVHEFTDPATAPAFAPQTNTAGKYGSFSLNADGEWIYHLGTPTTEPSTD